MRTVANTFFCFVRSLDDRSGYSLYSLRFPNDVTSKITKRGDANSLGVSIVLIEPMSYIEKEEIHNKGNIADHTIGCYRQYYRSTFSTL